jgi:HD-like signal output (HDOD) protein
MHNFLQTIEWPVMPEVGLALIRTLNDDDADIHSVGQIINKDPALTATLLRMANSAMFGLSGRVDSLEHAISVVGMSLIRARALSVCMARVVNLPVGLDRKAFWRYSMLCAGYSQWIARLCGMDEQEAWLAGMMLRLGEISLGKAKPFAVPKIEAQPIEPGERWVRQRQLIGFDEGQITAEIASHWDFPAMLVHGLRYAAQPLLSQEFSRLAAVLHLAGRLADGDTITDKALDLLPVIVLTMLKLDISTLGFNPPDAEAMADISMFQD